MCQALGDEIYTTHWGLDVDWNKYVVRRLAECICIKMRSSGVSCKHRNEPSVSIKSWEFLVQPNHCKLLKDSAP
jgi:hypothetical protein